MTKKILAALFLPLLMVSFLSAQSLAELSKKERERRAAAKGKTTIVTNDDLGKIKKKPAVSAGQPAKTGEENLAENPEAAEATTPPEGENGQAQPAPPEEAPPAGQEPVLTDQQFNARKTELEDQWNRAQEMVDLLTMKMNGLWQEFYSLDDMTARDRIQQQISENYEKLLKAQQDEAKTREELDAFIANTKREGVPQIWIR
ncbi:MAG: hypothetical protein MUP28_04835 [Candidatus Aminicenantes bacterium]|nr:hypothetical protein [Candidatus Aminicenantes bacterium]